MTRNKTLLNSSEGKSDGSGCILIKTDFENLGIIQQANAAICQMLGYQPDQLINTNIHHHIPSIYLEVHKEALTKYLNKISALDVFSGFSTSTIKHKKHIFVLTKFRTIVPCYFELYKTFSITSSKMLLALFYVDRLLMKADHCQIMIDKSYNIIALSPCIIYIIYIYYSLPNYLRTIS